MAFTNVQTKLSKALVTNTAGDYALRTVMDGEQDLNGEYLLNEQTTTNMMSKGTVYRFDGDDDVITVTDSAEIQNIFDNGGYLQAEIYPLSDGENDLGHIVAKRGGSNVWTWEVSAESAGFVKLTLNYSFSGTDMVASTGAVIPIGEQSKVGVCFTATAGEVPVFYLNGIAISSTATTSTGTRTTDVGANLFFGSYNGTFGVFDGEIGEVMLGNFAPTAAEVKDLISGNIPFKWQYGSQTSVVTGTDSTFAGAGNWTNSGLATFDVNTSVAGKAYALNDGGNDRINLAATLTIGKEYSYSIDATLDPLSAGSMTPSAIRIGSDLAVAGAYSAFTPQLVGATFTGTFIADGAILSVGLSASSVAGQAFSYDNILVYPLGAVALYTQDSISETTWYDKANGNDGAVTGAEVLNNPKNPEFDGIIMGDGFLNIGLTVELTIATGVVTASRSYHTIDTEADAASDDLETINGGKTGDLLMIRAASSSRTVVVKDGTGNLSLAGDFSLDNGSDKIMLVNAGGTNWEEVSRSDNGA